MLRVWDGFLSLLCGLLTLLIVGAPSWGAVAALRDGLVPTLVWGPLVLLGFVGAVMVFAFFRKAGRGIHPLRERRR